MIYKRCPKCRARIPSGTDCPKCKREYTKYDGVAKRYHTNRWRMLRQRIIERYDGLDVYELSKGNMVPAETVHHITTAKDDPSRFWDDTNLIPVSRASHDHIHAVYNSGADEKKKMIDTLYTLVRTAEL